MRPAPAHYRLPRLRRKSLRKCEDKQLSGMRLQRQGLAPGGLCGVGFLGSPRASAARDTRPFRLKRKPIELRRAALVMSTHAHPSGQHPISWRPAQAALACLPRHCAHPPDCTACNLFVLSYAYCTTRFLRGALCL